MPETRKPLLIYDGACKMCAAWAGRLRARTRETLEYSPLQKGDAVQLVTSTGEVYSGARALFEALAAAGTPGWRWAYRRIPGFATTSEAAYRLVAKLRS